MRGSMVPAQGAWSSYDCGMDDLRSRVRSARRAYYDEHEEAPTCLHLTRADESELMALPATEIGDATAAVMMEKGPRAAFPTYQGMVTVWDQQETSVGRCHPPG